MPAAGRRWPEYEYEVEEVENAGELIVGDAINDADVISRLTETGIRRARRRSGEAHDQKWFFKASANATQFVRNKIGGARKSILIVDPYFNALGLMAFGHATRRLDVELRILTSAQGLKESVTDNSGVSKGAQLHKALEETFEKTPGKPEIRVLLGNLMHDRFLVIDGEVWLSGNSLSTLGERAGMIVRLPDPEPVIIELEAFWRCGQVLSDWLSDRNTSPGN